ncbi:MAG: glutamate--tRNA ligase [Phycisphaerae bacterium]
MSATETAFVRCRFAPSPTGYLHLGGARTALFNFLLARRLGGVFIVRIEDTDQTRNIPGAESKLLDDLRWLGLLWDEGPQAGGLHGPYRQSERLEAYHAAVRHLIDAGKAYYALETDAQLAAMREQARREKRNFRYPRPDHSPTHAEAQAARGAGRAVVVRLKTPEREFVIRDQILGDVTVAAGDVDDFVLLKSDGWPTYHFAVVVDDEHMRITHVLRGQEHLLNTAKHLALQDALGYRTPAYAHLPIILNMDGSKMSKREKDRAVRTAFEAAVAAGTHDEAALLRASGVADAESLSAWRRGDVQLESDALARLACALHVQLPEIQVHDFRASGYLPEVLVNFIALMGWSPGDDREKMTLREMCERFSLERIGKTNARFDRAKLLNFNTTALAAAPIERKLSAMRDYLGLADGSPLAGADDTLLSRLISVNEGARVLRDIDEKCASIFQPDDQLTLDRDAVQKNLLKGDGAGLAVLRQVRTELAALADWSPSAIEALLRGFAERTGLGLGKVAQPIRVAVTGTTISPPIFDTLAILGRDRALARVDRALATLC